MKMKTLYEVGDVVVSPHQTDTEGEDYFEGEEEVKSVHHDHEVFLVRIDFDLMDPRDLLLCFR